MLSKCNMVYVEDIVKFYSMVKWSMKVAQFQDSFGILVLVTASSELAINSTWPFDWKVDFSPLICSFLAIYYKWMEVISYKNVQVHDRY